MLKRLSSFVLVLALGAASLARAKDAYYDIDVRDLKLLEGRLPEQSDNSNWQHLQRRQALEPYAWIEGGGEAYLTGPGTNGDYWSRFGGPQANSQLENHILLRAPEGRAIKGRLVVANADASGMDLLRFDVPASDARPEARDPFYRARLAHYRACCPVKSPVGPGSGTKSASPAWT